MKAMKRVWSLLLTLSFVFGMLGMGAQDVDAAYGGKEIITADDGGLFGQAEGSQGISQPYGKQMVSELMGRQILKLPTGVTLADNKKAGGALVTGTLTQLSQEKFTITEPFRFQGNNVGRVAVDGLAPRGKALYVEFYLDDETEAFARIQLRNSPKWTLEGERTADVLDKKISGEHRISFRVTGDQLEGEEEVTFLLRSIEFAENSLPVIYFDIDESQGTVAAMNASPDHSTECYGDMRVQIPEGYVSEYTNKKLKTETYSMEYIRGRGHSTWDADKKPYKIKLDKKADLFGMGKNKHWVLLANWYDNSMMRNKGTYWLGQQLGMEFTPKSVFVEVVMNGVYYGTYCLSEQVRVGGSRVDIDDLEDTKDAVDEPLITGGYLLSVEPYGDEEKKSFATTRGRNFLIESPSFEEYENQAQYNYIKNYVQKTEDAIYAKDFRLKDKTSYRDLLDVKSAVDYYWIQEISKNGDAFVTTSTYLYKKRNGKLYWGPLWDFDYVAWGSTEYEYLDYEGFMHNNSDYWFGRLMEDDSFVREMTGRWPAIKDKLLAFCEKGGALDQYYSQIEVSQRYNEEKWGMNSFDMEEEGEWKPLSFAEERERLRKWVLARTSWIDKNLSGLAPQKFTVKYMVDGKVYSKETVAAGRAIQGLPKQPVKKGYLFTGWYGKADGAEVKVDSGFEVFGNLTVKARWVKKNKVKPVKKLYLQQKEVYVPSWEEFSIAYDVLPLDASVTDVSWKSSNEKVALVDENGRVETLEYGTAKITGTCHNGVKASFTLHVSAIDFIQPEKISFGKSSLTVDAGGWKKLGVKIFPKECFGGELGFLSVDPKIAEVTAAGVVLGKKKGSTTVIIYNNYYGKVKMWGKCTVTVKSALRRGKVFADFGLKYRIMKLGKDASVSCIGLEKASPKKVNIPDTVSYQGKKFRVSSVGKGAFSGTRATSVVLGRNITAVGDQAFANCKNLSSITVKGSRLKKVGGKALKGIGKKAVIKVPKKKHKAYRRLFTPSTGYRRQTMKIRGM